MQTLNDTEQEKCRTHAGLFEVLSDIFKPQHIKAILSMQYCKLGREQNINVGEWIGTLDLNPMSAVTKKKDRRLKEQFIKSIRNEEVMTEIMRKLTATKN